MRLAKGHNTVLPVRLVPATPQSRGKHSTTEPLCSQIIFCTIKILQNGYLIVLTSVGKNNCFNITLKV